MSRPCRMSVLALAWGLAASGCFAIPELSLIEPAGGPRGSETTIGCVGKHLDSATQLQFYSLGFSARLVEEPAAPSTDSGADKKGAAKKKPNKKKGGKRPSVWFAVSVPADAPTGQHVMRVLTPDGLSELVTFWVSPYENTAEREPNNTREQAQRIEQGITINGRVDKEDVDSFVVSAKKGQRLTAEVTGMRMCRKLFDPQLSIQDSRRFELAVCDDSSVSRQDPFVSVIIPEDGDYVISIREASYGGNAASRYRLTVGAQPRPTMTFPAGGQRGETLAFRYVGDPKGERSVTMVLPDREEARLPVMATEEGHVPATPNFLRVSSFPSVREDGDNNERQDARAWTNGVPVAFDGIIEAAGDVDWFSFPARKGEALHIRVFARGIGSPLDPVLGLYDEKGKLITRKDDDKGLDSYIRFKPKKDGTYGLRIKDHLDQGGVDYVYRIEVEAVKPYATLTVLPGKQYTQLNQVVAIPRGGFFGIDVKAIREDCSGPITMSITNLPEGVSVNAPVLHDKTDSVPLVFHAAADAPAGLSLASVSGEGGSGDAQFPARFDQRIELVHGTPNNSVYSDVRLTRLAVAVVDELPFSIAIEPLAVPLVRYGQNRLKVRVTRKEGFTKPITLKMMSKPTGVGSETEITVAPGKTNAIYNLNAGSDAIPGVWPVSIQASAVSDAGLSWCAAEIIGLEVADPYLTGEIKLAAVEQGGEVGLSCVLNQVVPFEGSATVRVLGLPLKVTTEAKDISSDDKELFFQLKTDAETPLGTHKSLFLNITVMKEGHPIVHNVAGGGTLRVDPPAKEGKVVVKKKKKAAAPVKGLSRLEQLRRDAEARRKAQMGADS